MEYMGAGSLCDLMAICERTLTEAQIAAVIKQSLMGLAYLHGAKKIHRDIKSGNVLLNHKGECKLADFGVSAELATTMSKRKTVIGTPYWMAPEVLHAAEYNGKADIWSLAITAIELAVGEPPHSNVHPMRAIFMIPNSDPPTLPEPTKWSNSFHEFLRVCLQKNPDQRPTAKQLLETSPFIINAKGPAVIAALVDECMSAIEEYRAAEAAEAQRDANNGTTQYGHTMTQITHQQSQLNTMQNSGTMIQTAGNNSGTVNFGTIIPSKTAQDSGTVQFSSGSLNSYSDSFDQQHDDEHDYDSNSGTMVYAGGAQGGTMRGSKNTGTMLTPQASSAASSSAAASGNAGRTNYAEPTYMAHIRQQRSQQGTMISSAPSKPAAKTDTIKPATPLASTTTQSVTAHSSSSSANVVAPSTSPSSSHTSSTTDLYRTNADLSALNVSLSSSMNDLSAALNAIILAEQSEKLALERFYEQHRKQIRTLMQIKQSQVQSNTNTNTNTNNNVTTNNTHNNQNGSTPSAGKSPNNSSSQAANPRPTSTHR